MKETSHALTRIIEWPREQFYIWVPSAFTDAVPEGAQCMLCQYLNPYLTFLCGARNLHINWFLSLTAENFA